MGSTFVDINGFGFWAYDRDLAVWLRLLALQIPEPNDSTSAEIRKTTYEVRNQWLLASKGCFGGMVPVNLENIVSTAEGRLIVTNAINSLLFELNTARTVLDRNTLSLLGIEGQNWTLDLETWRLVEIGEAFLALINGQIHTRAGDKVPMPGSDLDRRR